MKTNNSNKRGEVSSTARVLGILVSIFFIPVLLISSFSIYVLFSSKTNSEIPSAFGYSVVTVNEAVGDFEQGQTVLVKKVPIQEIRKEQFVAYVVPTEEQPENPDEIEVVFKEVLDISTDEETGDLYFSFAAQTYATVEDAIIGVYDQTNPEALIGILKFFSVQSNVLLFGLSPLFILLVVLGLQIVEQLSIIKTNKEIDNALIKANQAGFETGAGNKPEEEIVQEEQKGIEPKAFKTAPKAKKPKAAPMPPKAPEKPMGPPKAPQRKAPPKAPAKPMGPPKAPGKPPMPPKAPGRPVPPKK